MYKVLTPNVSQKVCNHADYLCNLTSGLGELCEIRGGRPELPVLNSPCGFCGRKATLEKDIQTPNSPCGLCGRKATLEADIQTPNSPYGFLSLIHI